MPGRAQAVRFDGAGSRALLVPEEGPLPRSDARWQRKTRGEDLPEACGGGSVACSKSSRPGLEEQEGILRFESFSSARPQPPVSRCSPGGCSIRNGRPGSSGFTLAGRQL